MNLSLQPIHQELDKSSDKWDNYFGVYERHIIPALFRVPRSKVVLVEVGVQAGGSLDMWAEYTKHHGVETDIHGIDIDPSCALHDYSQNPNIQVHIGDQNDNHFWDGFLKVVPRIDAFIDDGGHYMDGQITTLERVWPHITPGGVFICEDTHTSYNSYNGGGFGYHASFLEYVKKRIDDIHHNHIPDMKYHGPGIFGDLCSLHVYDSIVVLEKKSANYKRPERVFPRKFNTN